MRILYTTKLNDETPALAQRHRATPIWARPQVGEHVVAVEVPRRLAREIHE